jgi:hypothetical protein
MKDILIGSILRPVVAIDVTRTKICAPWSIDSWEREKLKKFYWGGKDKFHALKYEIAVSLGKYNKIVFLSGGHAGSIHDITIARQYFLNILSPNESAVADTGYQGEYKFIIPMPETSYQNIYQNVIMAGYRQNVERMNNRIKIFTTARLWRGQRSNHHHVFFVICKITNLELDVSPLNGNIPKRDPIDCNY